MTDEDPFASFDLFAELLEAGIDVVSSGPVLLQYPFGIVPQEMTDRLQQAGEKGNASLYVNGIDPGFANDVLPLVMTSLSQRVDLVRCSEIADYSTYYQPFVNGELFGFGKPMDEVPMLFSGGILIDGLGLGRADHRRWSRRHPRRAAGGEGRVRPGRERRRDGQLHHPRRHPLRRAVPGDRQGRRNVPRVVLEHVTRTHPDQMPEWPRARRRAATAATASRSRASR